MTRPPFIPTPSLALCAVALWSLLVPHGAAGQSAPTDPLWAEMSRTVAQGDFEGYSALYHPQAVLVNGSSASIIPIADALAGWKTGFDDTAAGEMGAQVTFRFSERLVGPTEVHETGIFRYVAHSRGGSPEVALIHFQALSLLTDGEWKLLMEYQIRPATEAEWEAAAVPNP